MEDPQWARVLHYCIEKLHRMPEECGGVRWDSLMAGMALAEAEAEQMEKMADGRG